MGQGMQIDPTRERIINQIRRRLDVLHNNLINPSDPKEVPTLSQQALDYIHNKGLEIAHLSTGIVIKVDPAVTDDNGKISARGLARHYLEEIKEDLDNG